MEKKNKLKIAASVCTVLLGVTILTESIFTYQFGTEFTMTSGLYEKAFIKNGITPIIPDDDDKKIIGNLIYPNLENGIVIPEDKVKMIELAEKYIKSQNADSMLLGCTEIPLMLSDEDISVPTLNSTDIHINAIYRYAEG